MVERPVLEAVVFDAGGTLVRLDFEWMSELVRGLGHEVDAGALRRSEVAARRAFDREFDQPPPVAVAGAPRLSERGDTHLYFRVILEAAGVPPALVGPALERCFERHAGPGLWTRAAEGARGCVDALALLGLRLACVSNSDGRAGEHLAACDMLRGLEFVVDSHHVGVAKPEAGIFHVALERLGLPAERTLYVGDLRQVDGAGARGAGLHFVLLDPYRDYAAAGEPAVATIAQVPAWATANFTLAPARPRGAR
jgi:putative hydrolase of the HAD superfamily